MASPTHVFLAFSYSTLRVQFGIEGYIAAEAHRLKINLISHSNIGLCVIFRLKRHASFATCFVLTYLSVWRIRFIFKILSLQSYYSPFP